MSEKNVIQTKDICGMIELKPEALAKNKGIKVAASEEASKESGYPDNSMEDIADVVVLNKREQHRLYCIRRSLMFRYCQRKKR